MATRHTHKKPRFDTRHMAKKLDTMLDTVVERGIYAIQKNTDLGHYYIIDVKDKTVMVDWIPSKKQAQRVCDNLNARRRKLNREYLQEASYRFRRYSRLSNDCLYFIHTLDHTDDPVTRGAVTARLHHTRATLEQISRSLASLM